MNTDPVNIVDDFVPGPHLQPSSLVLVPDFPLGIPSPSSKVGRCPQPIGGSISGFNPAGQGDCSRDGEQQFQGSQIWAKTEVFSPGVAAVSHEPRLAGSHLAFKRTSWAVW